MKIAHLIMAHRDPEHVSRLATRLASISDVYIHIDLKSDLTRFSERNTETNVHFLQDRLNVEWGGWNSVAAEILLLKAALSQDNYDRLVFLQGADYPIKTNAEIQRFYHSKPEVEFVRGCNCTQSRDGYFRDRCYGFWMLNHMNRFRLLKKAWNRLTRELHIEIRNGYASGNGVKHEVFWGSAQWAITGNCAKYLIDFYDNHPDYNRWYYHCFPADELYFTTIIMNSEFAEKTSFGGPEKEQKWLANWRNLHYFEYRDGRIRTFFQRDYAELLEREELYVRKVNTVDSTELLDLLDQNN